MPCMLIGVPVLPWTLRPCRTNMGRARSDGTLWPCPGNTQAGGASSEWSVTAPPHGLIQEAQGGNCDQHPLRRVHHHKSTALPSRQHSRLKHLQLTVFVQVRHFSVSEFCGNVRIPQQPCEDEHCQTQDVTVALQWDQLSKDCLF